MRVEELPIAGAWSFTPTQHGDERGLFLEWFKSELFAEVTGRDLRLAQANLSVSAAGALRGVHFADIPPGQAKYVACPRGAVLDVVVDIRRGSPTFGRSTSVLLDDVDRRAVFLSEGLGHAFLSLEDGSTVTYLCSAPYAPGREHGINPLDPALDIDWPRNGRDGRELTYELSPKDSSAPTLAEADAAGLLPEWSAVQEFVRHLSH